MTVCHLCKIELNPHNVMATEKVLYDVDICRTCFGYPDYEAAGIKCSGPRFNWDPREALREKVAKTPDLPPTQGTPQDGRPNVSVDRKQGKVD